MIRVLAIVTAVLTHLESFTVIDLALNSDVVTSFALSAFEGDLHPLVISWHVSLRSIFF